MQPYTDLRALIIKDIMEVILTFEGLNSKFQKYVMITFNGISDLIVWMLVGNDNILCHPA